MSDRPVRFGIVIQTPKDPQSAVYIASQSLAASLQSLGHLVAVVSPADFPSGDRFGGRWVPLVFPLAVARWLRRHRNDFDVVMFHSYSGWLATTLLGGRLRSVVMFHGMEPLYHQELREEAVIDGRPLSRRYRFLQEYAMPAMLRIACRRATAVTCYNGTEAEYLVERRWVPARKVRVLAHGVPERFFGPPREPRPARTLLFVGQWLPMKGVRYLREAATGLLRESPSLRLLCAGTLNAEEVVKAAFPSDVQDRVAALPRVDRDSLASLYREADVFVFPSLYEGFGMAIVEAMASRLPIVCTPVGVAADALCHDENALIVPRRDSNSIAVAVRRLLSDPILAARLGNAAGEAARSYTGDVVMQQTLDAIMAVAGRPR